MTHGPNRPISFEKARKLLWERLTTSQGIDFGDQLEGWGDENRRSETDKLHGEKLEGLWNDADINLQGWIITERLHCWTDELGDWKAVSRSELKAALLRPHDEPWGIYVDQDQLFAVAAKQWPEKFGHTEKTNVPREADGRTTKRRGRPRGDGFSLKHVPIFEKILKAQRESGDVHSQHALIVKFADEADGNSVQAKVDRLRKTLPRWLDKNGIEWISSK